MKRQKRVMIWLPHQSHLKSIWFGGRVQFSLLKMEGCFKRNTKIPGKQKSEILSHAQCFLLPHQLSIHDCILLLLRTIFWKITTAPMFVDKNWWTKRLFRPISRNFLNSSLIPENSNSQRSFGFGIVALKCTLQDCGEVCRRYCQKTGFLQI